VITKGVKTRVASTTPWPKIVRTARARKPRRFNHFQIPDIGRSVTSIHATTSTLLQKHRVVWGTPEFPFWEIRDGQRAAVQQQPESQRGTERSCLHQPSDSRYSVNPSRAAR
jgi:hypothetical protein